MGTLSLLLPVKARGQRPAIIARELALELAEGTTWPLLLEHAPGIATVVPDLLSRRFQPGVQFPLPPTLRDVPELTLVPRTAAYIRTLP